MIQVLTTPTDGRLAFLNRGRTPLMGKSPSFIYWAWHSVVWNIPGEPGSPVPAVLPVSFASLLAGRA